MDNDGNVACTDCWNDRIQVFCPKTGNVIKHFGKRGQVNGPEFYLPVGISIDTNGNFYICDYGNHRIQVFDPSGNWLRIIGFNGTGMI